MKKNKPENITQAFQDWQDGEDYNRRLNYSGYDYYGMLDLSDSMYAGDQWKGMARIEGADPVFNIIKPSAEYIIATILSSRISGKFSIEGMDETDPNNAARLEAIRYLDKHMQYHWDRLGIDYLSRDTLKDGAIAGDYYWHTYWDSQKDTGQPEVAGQKYKGDFCTELVDGVNVMFGNPNESDPQKQPFILVSGRAMVRTLRAEAKANGMTDQEVNQIVSDEDWTLEVGDRGKVEMDDANDTGKARYIYKYTKRDGAIWCEKVTQSATVKAEWKTKNKRYPIACGNWEKRKNSHRGNPFVLYAIKNQRYINKQFALLMIWMIKNALGKYIIDETKIQGFTNEIGEMVRVQGSPRDAVMQIQPGNINNTVLDLIDMTIKNTKDALGANDAARGNITNPQNTSAIIANSQLSAIPLENIKVNFMQFLEQQYLIWADFIVSMYENDRMMSYVDENGNQRVTPFKKSDLEKAILNVKVDIGPSSYYNEMVTQSALDSLLAANRISMVQYLERVKEGTIPKSKELIEQLKAQEQAQVQMAGAGQPQEAPVTLEELTEGMSEEEIQALMDDPAKMEELKKMGVQ